MPVGTSGRIVIEVDPLLKQQLYHGLREDGLTLKDWFQQHLHDYLNSREQLPLAFDEPRAYGGARR
jgi:hypothetical protein